MNRVELTRVVRFNLNELGARNGAHEFEELCRQLAIMTIASNIVRATGPVSAGGDQGRDFETFRTYIAGTAIAGSTLVGRASGKNLAFACTLQQDNIKSKIKSDVAAILGGSEPVETVYVFTEVNVVVSDRHELQTHVRSTYGVGLEILDGQAVAEQLATPETFWIADQFLGLASDVYLDELEADAGTWYGELRDKWRGHSDVAGTFGEYFDLRRGVRHATVTESAKGDLPLWIGRLNDLLRVAPDFLQRKAFYESAVASLRGLGTLKAHEADLRRYFDGSVEHTDVGSLRDSQILLMYVAGAKRRGLVEVTADEIESWGERLDSHLDELVESATNPGVKAELLHSLAAVRLLPRSEPDTGPTPDQLGAAFSTMRKIVELAAEAELFPIDRFADWVAVVAPLIAELDGYADFVDQIDKLVIARAGRAVAAQHRRDRAMALYQSAQLLAALRALHQTRIDWFAGDTIRGSLLAMMMISHIYDRLHLPLAAKYYALAAAHLAGNLGDDSLLDIVPRGILMAASADYQQGAFIGFLRLAETGLYLRYVIQGKHPAEIEETENVVLGLTVLTQYARSQDPGLLATIEESLSKLNLRDEIAQVIEDAATPDIYETPATFAAVFEEQLGAIAFSDTGPQRLIRWRALGLTWQVTFVNDYETTRAAERFCAMAQVLFADLAGVELALLPTDISIRLSVSDTGSIAEPQPSNDGRSWNVSVPRQLNDGDINRGIAETIGVIAHVLIEASLMPSRDAMKVIESAYDAGLPGKLTPETTYDRSFHEFVRPNEFGAEIRAERKQLTEDRLPDPLEAVELTWRGGPGPNYSSEKAQEYLGNRYERLASALRLTLPRLLATMEGRQTVQLLRSEGWLDWRILSAIANAAANWRIAQSNPRSVDERRQLLGLYMQEEEQSFPEVPLDQLSFSNLRMADQLGMMSTVQIWGHEARQRTPDLPAVRKFLDERYRNDKDDVEHEDLLR